MLEVEIKLPIEWNKEGRIAGRAAENVFEKLLSLGFSEHAHIRETDLYFDNADSFIRSGGYALRVRTDEDLVSGIVTASMNFKGKKADSHTMTRPEYETEIGEAEAGCRILEALGFHPVQPKVVKVRTEMKCGEMTACLDRVEGLGDFLEIEILLPDADGKEESLQRIEKTLEMLGYSMADTVKTSYLSMLQG